MMPWREHPTKAESVHPCREDARLQVFPGPTAALQEQEIIMYFKVLRFRAFTLLKQNLSYPTLSRPILPDVAAF